MQTLISKHTANLLKLIALQSETGYNDAHMKKGEASHGQAHALMFAAVAIPSILLLHYILLPTRLTTLPGGKVYLILLLISWTVFSVWMLRRARLSTEAKQSAIVYHHIFFAMYCVLAGISAVSILVWVLLSIIAHIQADWRGFGLSLGLMMFLVAVDPALRLYDLDILALNYVSLVVAILVAFVLISFRPVRTVQNTAKLRESEHREAAERERILTIVNNLADAIFAIDQKGKITIFNAASLNLLDTNTSLEGASINSVLDVTDETGASVDVFDRIKAARVVTIDDTLRLKTADEVIRLELTFAPIRSSFSVDDTAGSGLGYIVIARDVTRLKSLEEERDEFISVVSHELRTPITVTEGTISNVQLMMERGQVDSKDIAKHLAEAHEQVIYLARMINDLSTLSRAERGVAAEPETIDVAELAHALYNEYEPEAAKQSLHLNLELGPKLGTVSASRLYLHELIQNFITNGIKYTQKGNVTLKITKSADQIHFVVSDSGIGISRSDQAKVFNKFYRSEDYRTRETGGTGLGLYVAAKLARKLNTKIELKSRLNHGSTFSFSMPAGSAKK